MMRKLNLLFRPLAVAVCVAVSTLAPCSSLHAQKSAAGVSVDSLASNFEGMIKGREAGVMVSTSDNSPAAAFNVIIRGLKTFRGQNEPLVVIDGAVLNPQSMDTFRALIEDNSDYQTVLNSLSMLNPLDIASVQYLKDAYSTSMYGSLGGANGVIVITTKRGNANAKRPDVKWQSEFGLSTLYSQKKMLGRSEFLDFLSQTDPSSQILSQADLQGVNWQKEATRTAFSQRHYVSIAGSSRSSNYFLSANFSDERGIVNRSEAQTGALRINYDFQLGRNATLSTNNILTHSVMDLVAGTAPVGTSTATKSMVLSQPLWLSNSLADRDLSNSDLISENYRSWQADYDDHTNQYRLVSDTRLSVGLFRFLKWNTNFGLDYRNDNRRRWIGNTIEKGFEKNSQVGITTLSGMRYTADSRLAFDYTLGRHRIAASADAALYGDMFENNVRQSYDFDFPELRGLMTGNKFPDDFGNPTTAPVYNVYNTSTFGYAALVNAQYTFDKQIHVAAALRADALNRYNTTPATMDYYPSVSARWNLNKAKWLWGDRSPLASFSAFDLRASWGRSGTQNVSIYRTIDSYVPASVDYPLPTDFMRSLVYSVLWKMRNDQVDAGVDMRLLKDRVALSVGYYNSFATDMLGLYNTGLTGGATPVDGTRSSGKVRNRGVELEVSATVIDTKDLKWTVGTNCTYNNNKIIDTGFGGDYTGPSVGTNPTGENLYSTIVAAGQSVGAFYGFRTAGVVHEQNLPYVPKVNGVKPSVGDVMLVDLDGDMNVTNADRTVIGNPNPKFFGGFYTNVTWRRWSFDLMLDWRAGCDVMNINLLDKNNFASGVTHNISREAFRNAYNSATNPQGSYPAMDGAGQYLITDRLIENGSFLRISDISAKYSIPLQGAKWLSNAFVRLSVRNPYVLTGYSGYDPEVNGYTFQPMRWGLDSGSYPSSRSFVISLGANF